MVEMKKFYKELEARFDYLNTEENLKSPYMQARLDECRLTMVAVQAVLIKQFDK